MWFASLGVVVVLAVGSVVPAWMANGVAGALTETFGQRPQVTVEADPFLDLPQGRVPHMHVLALEAPIGPLRLSAVELDVRDLRLPPAAVLGLAEPVLLAPAPARLRITETEDGLKRDLAAFLATLAADPKALSGTPFQRLVGGRGPLALGSLAIAHDELNVTVTAQGKDGVLPISLGFGLAIADGRRLVPKDPHAQVGGTALPGMLLKLAAKSAGALLDLDKLGPELAGWTLTDVSLADGRLEVVLAGEIPVKAP